MISPQNPYAAPEIDADSEELVPVAPQRAKRRIRRQGQFLVLPVHGARLPERCVVCNAPGAVRSWRKLHRHAPGYYVLIFINPIIYLIVAFIVRKRVSFEMSLCAQHARRRQSGLMIGWLGTLACLAATLALLSSDTRNSLLTLAVLLLLIACPFVGMALARVVTVHNIDKRSAWLYVGRPFLDSL
jgi:hypothetical protein